MIDLLIILINSPVMYEQFAPAAPAKISNKIPFVLGNGFINTKVLRKCANKLNILGNFTEDYRFYGK